MLNNKKIISDGRIRSGVSKLIELYEKLCDKMTGEDLSIDLYLIEYFSSV